MTAPEGNPGVRARSAAAAALRRQLAQRTKQFEAFESWERAQQRAAGPPNEAEVRRNLAWLNDAYEFARRTGSIGPNAPERHLDDLISWVKLWRRAWRADRAA